MNNFKQFSESVIKKVKGSKFQADWAFGPFDYYEDAVEWQDEQLAKELGLDKPDPKTGMYAAWESWLERDGDDIWIVANLPTTTNKS